MIYRKWILVAVLASMLVGCNNRWNSGDRVLVSKCSYDNGFTGPQRYEVVVFKYPVNPMEKGTPKNYIKRLLGLPGELLAIFFGRVYRWTPPENAPPPFDDQRDAKADARDLWHDKFMHVNDNTSRKWFEDGQFEILRKSPRTMLALRRIVYDNDYQAKDLAKFPGKYDRWNPLPNSSWKADGPTGFQHQGNADGQVDWLRYQHLLRPADNVLGGAAKVEPKLITDSMSYNNFKSKLVNKGDRERDKEIITDESARVHPHWVGDLMLECDVQVVEPKGELLLELSKGIYRYQASWDLATGECTLYRVGLDKKKPEQLGKSRTTAVKSPGNYMLRFANVDARLTVWVDRALPFDDGHVYDPPEVKSKADREKKVSDEEIKARRGPRGDNDLQPASIGSKGANVKIAHVRLWRDTYYTTSVQGADFNPPFSADADEWAKPGAWEPIQKQNFATMYVQPGHYLCLGDNSQASSDSRQWGVVPDRLMLGRALVVYFPLDRIGLIR